MTEFKEMVKRVSLLPLAYRVLRHGYSNCRLKLKSTQGVFTEIYQANKWGGRASVSGTGSDTEQTRVVTLALPKLLRELSVMSMLDIPCGDFYWMKSVNLEGLRYVGADIVVPLIQQNRQRYEHNDVHFENLDLIRDRLPKVDLVFCRDCLVHLSFKDIFLALHNICDSGSKLLLTTTFTERGANRDIPTGGWRVLNLRAAPFMLPEPLELINEECTEDNGAYHDKCLGLWRIADISECLARHAGQ